MSSHSHETKSDRPIPTRISSSEGLACPIPSCPLVLKGETPHRYLRRHLKYPRLHGRTGQEKEAWLNLHEIEHERLLATLGLTPFHNPNPKEVRKVSQTDRVNIIIKLAEDNNAEDKRKSRTAEFELRAKSMGITGEKSVAQRVAIWEGMGLPNRAVTISELVFFLCSNLEIIVGLLLIDMGG
ncbi:hypothetical protein B9Z19DRAFT_1061050 [Tuber borchii]|uniref:Uncharacterized protein n=1 Tax=Tuber borchii TaxID=42251 RepID=A0A2T7A6J7_TUBBO|nr:hypothetical protein B9Z19DRAFT_1061050 [Tuber borchii]